MQKIVHPHVVTAIRLLFAVNFIINGLNPFLHFYELPSPSKAAAAFGSALLQTGYLFLIVKIVEILVGVLLLLNRLVPLSLILIFPISLNIFLFNTILEPAAAGIGILVLALNLYLCVAYRKYYKPLLTVKAYLP